MNELPRRRATDVVCSDDEMENDATRTADDAEEEDDGDREARWRMERLEREKFLAEHKVVTVCFASQNN